VKAGEVISVEGLRVKPVEVDHVVPTLGYVIEDERRPGRFRSRLRPDASDLGCG
jgi:ribonuclease BN (tRNA processing enzyme)